MIPSPLDEVMAVLGNIVKSSRFTASVFRLVAPIVGENVAKLSLIEGSMADLAILHFFYDILVPENLLGRSRKFFI